MAEKNDPRTDRHPNDGTPGSYPDPPSNSKPEPAAGGVGNKPDSSPAPAQPTNPVPPSAPNK